MKSLRATQKTDGNRHAVQREDLAHLVVDGARLAAGIQLAALGGDIKEVFETATILVPGGHHVVIAGLLACRRDLGNRYRAIEGLA